MDNENWDEITAELVRNSAFTDLVAGGGKSNQNPNQYPNQYPNQHPNQPQHRRDNMAMVNPAFFLG